jgi:hypothetical protein
MGVGRQYAGLGRQTLQQCDTQSWEDDEQRQEGKAAHMHVRGQLEDVCEPAQG